MRGTCGGELSIPFCFLMGLFNKQREDFSLLARGMQLLMAGRQKSQCVTISISLCFHSAPKTASTATATATTQGEQPRATDIPFSPSCTVSQ